MLRAVYTGPERRSGTSWNVHYWRAVIDLLPPACRVLVRKFAPWAVVAVGLAALLAAAIWSTSAHAAECYELRQGQVTAAGLAAEHATGFADREAAIVALADVTDGAATVATVCEVETAPGGLTLDAHGCYWYSETGPMNEPFIPARRVNHGPLPPTVDEMPAAGRGVGIRVNRYCVNGPPAPGTVKPPWPLSAEIECLDKCSTALGLAFFDGVVEKNSGVGFVYSKLGNVGGMVASLGINWGVLAYARSKPYPTCVYTLTWKNRITGMVGWSNLITLGGLVLDTAVPLAGSLIGGGIVVGTTQDERYKRAAADECAYASNEADPFLVTANLRWHLANSK